MRILIALTLLLLAFADHAAAEPRATLRWNDCGDAGQTARSIACNTNEGASELVVSFMPPAWLEQLTGFSSAIEIVPYADELPSWWKVFVPTSCRPDVLSLILAPDASTSPVCVQPWPAVPGGSITSYSYQGVHPNWWGNNARVTLAAGVPTSWVGPVSPDSEYFAYRLRIGHARTSGADACDGCAMAACLELRSLSLWQPAGVGDVELAEGWRTVGWQGTRHFPSCYTPTHNRTWGAIKSLYR